MKTLGKSILVLALVGVVLAGGLGWAAAGAPGAPSWMRERMPMAHNEGPMMDGHAQSMERMGMHGGGAASSSGAVETAQVSIRDTSYEPQTIRVRVGDTVTWTNHDPLEHTVTSDDGAFDSGPLAQDYVFSWTFYEPGTYAYHCEPHSYLHSDGTWRGQTGVVIVE